MQHRQVALFVLTNQTNELMNCVIKNVANFLIRLQPNCMHDIIQCYSLWISIGKSVY